MKGVNIYQPLEESKEPQTVVATNTYNENITLRDLWPNEANDFTPWLMKTEIVPTILSLIDAEDYLFWKREIPVGDYRIDMIYHSKKGNSYIVENQYGLSDNKHLGQILIYRYLTKIPNILWICDSVSLEHKRVLKEMKDMNCILCGVQIHSKYNLLHQLLGYKMIFTISAEKNIQIIFNVNADLTKVVFDSII